MTGLYRDAPHMLLSFTRSSRVISTDMHLIGRLGRAFHVHYHSTAWVRKYAQQDFRFVFQGPYHPGVTTMLKRDAYPRA